MTSPPGGHLVNALVVGALLLSCSTTGLRGEPDAFEDVATDVDVESEPSCWDHDGDGYLDAACGGDDCDDLRDDVHPGAPEVCLDGVDQDCDGAVDGPRPMLTEIRLTSSNRAHDETCLTWTGSEFVVGWTEKPDGVGDDLLLQRVRGDGSLAGGAMLLTGAYDGDNRHPAIVWNGAGLSVVWRWGLAVRYSRVAPNLEEELVRTALPHAGWPAIAWTGSEHGIAWYSREYPDYVPYLYFLAVDIDGRVTSDPAGEPTVLDGRGSSDAPVSLEWTGSEFGLAWVGLFARVGPRADLLSGPDWILSGGAFLTRIAWTGSEYGVLQVNPPFQVEFFPMSPAGETAGSGTVVAYSEPALPADIAIDIAWTGSEFAVAWNSGAEEEQTIEFTTLDSAGEILHPSTTVSTETSMKAGMRMVWSGSEVGIVWADYRNCDPDPMLGPCKADVYMTRVGFCE